MIQVFVGSGGKTTLIKEAAARYRAQGKTVFVTTTTHMFIEEDTLLTDDADMIIRHLKEKGYAMAGIPEGSKIRGVSRETCAAVCAHADVVLVEGDGSGQLPLKFPNSMEPVIPDNADEIYVVCSLNGLGKRAGDVCHRLELAKERTGLKEDTIINPVHVQALVTEGYLKPLREKYPQKKISLIVRHDESLYQRVIASMLQSGEDVSAVCEEWFHPQPRLVICGGGHVAREVAALASRLDFRIRVIDDRADFTDEKRFPTADEIFCDSYGNLEKYLEPGAYYVVMTPNHKADYQCVKTILSSDYSYLGMIGSRRKVAVTFQNLREEGFKEEQIETIFSPIGLSIGAVTPAEIAVSILAQIIQEKNRSHAASADRELLEVREQGVLCVITEKHGSAPRGVGSMMFVGKDLVLGSIGGGTAEYRAICDARQDASLTVRRYSMTGKEAEEIGMVCGGTVQVLFVPV